MWRVLLIFIIINQGSLKMIKLPEPDRGGKRRLEEVINERRSIREYADSPLTIKEVSQLLWAVQGITSPDGKRAAPSAGATYPMEIYIIVGTVEGLETGVYHYLPHKHSLELTIKGDLREEIYKASLWQEMLLEAPLTIVIAAEYERTTRRYGKRGIRYVHMEAGHIGQNIYLEATALGLGTVAVGAFDDQKVKNTLKIQEEPLYLYPVGRRK